MYDVTIIGKGPAGISASLYTKRAGLNTLIIGKDGGALEGAEKIENYYGLDKALTGKELILRGIKQAEELNIEIITDEVVDIKNENCYKILTRKNTYESKTLILATGSNRKTPKISRTNRI